MPRADRWIQVAGTAFSAGQLLWALFGAAVAVTIDVTVINIIHAGLLDGSAAASRQRLAPVMPADVIDLESWPLPESGVSREVYDEALTQLEEARRVISEQSRALADADVLREQLQGSQAALGRVERQATQLEAELLRAERLAAEARSERDQYLAAVTEAVRRQQAERRRADALARMGECVHDNRDLRPPRALDSVAGCTVEQELRFGRELRFYGQRTPIQIGFPIVLSVVPSEMGTGRFSYTWRLDDCRSGQVNGPITGPTFEFFMRARGECSIQLNDGYNSYQFTYAAY